MLHHDQKVRKSLHPFLGLCSQRAQHVDVHLAERSHTFCASHVSKQQAQHLLHIVGRGWICRLKEVVNEYTSALGSCTPSVPTCPKALDKLSLLSKFFLQELIMNTCSCADSRRR